MIINIIIIILTTIIAIIFIIVIVSRTEVLKTFLLTARKAKKHDGLFQWIELFRNAE